MSTKSITGTAMLLAIALVAQSLRIIFPFIPNQVSQFVIGSIVSATFVLAAWRYGWKCGLIIAWVAPIVAHVQGMLPIAPLIIVTGLGTSIYVAIVSALHHASKRLLIVAASLGRTVVLYFGAIVLVSWLGITGPKANALLVAFSWPQLITSTLGILLAMAVERRSHS